TAPDKRAGMTTNAGPLKSASSWWNATRKTEAGAGRAKIAPPGDQKNNPQGGLTLLRTLLARGRPGRSSPSAGRQNDFPLRDRKWLRPFADEPGNMARCALGNKSCRQRARAARPVLIRRTDCPVAYEGSSAALPAASPRPSAERFLRLEVVLDKGVDDGVDVG